jgi:hypothetical protein
MAGDALINTAHRSIFIDSGGRFCGGGSSKDVSGFTLSPFLKKAYTSDAPPEAGFTEIALHAFARLNCANVSLEPTQQHPLRPHKNDPKRPSIAWHEITVTAPPMTRQSGPTRTDDDPIWIRSHWVRGHYADYTRGKGLFGNPKLRKMYWFPEHKRGSPEVGAVESSYAIEAKAN